MRYDAATGRAELIAWDDLAPTMSDRLHPLLNPFGSRIGRDAIIIRSVHTPDPDRRARSPLVINISRLGRRPGSMMTLHETVPSPSRQKKSASNRSMAGINAIS